MKNKKTIYVDMDGVLADFDKRYQQTFGATPMEVRRTKGYDEYRRNWDTMINDRHFATLDRRDGYEDLVAFLEKARVEHNITIAILSSSSNIESHHIVQRDKLQWLDDQGIKWPAIIVPGRYLKAMYADVDSFLIDDTPDNIESFINKGGQAVLHESKDMWRTFYRIAQWVEGKPQYDETDRQSYEESK
jgi:5'(3')-deoxyribonucleotidase